MYQTFKNDKNEISSMTVGKSIYIRESSGKIIEIPTEDEAYEYLHDNGYKLCSST